MTTPEEEAHWRKGFIIMNLIRIGATVVVLLAILLWQSDLIVEGGHIIGFPLALAALVVSFFAPKWFAGRWRAPPGP
jgi:hypothetical protein